MNKHDILRAHVARFVPLTDEQADYFVSHFREHSFKKGQTVLGEGERVDKEYFVLSGCLKAFFINDDARMFILQFALPTWWTSDYGALYNEARASICVDCITDAVVLSLTNTDREQMCKEVHAIEHFFRWRTNRGYVAAQKRLLSLMNNDARARYEELMQQYPELYNLVPKQWIAAYLGVSRETLSRLYQNVR
ncbi:Crp/Fnr family transcriptional regulator [Dinghuibacter silviterrae]|uniref:CRP-like cAMP-binding protein n=1 Tax=Dinghuibacter silviterrae TaxID=1539049 RepID=A0A4R8DF69_9BACT|nr:Crp/Fnr family transcriptional regulator [Dinghuibacter silviterrae]TDW96233.1 CRP-like cAMP-binding protein [Dinghuibacter silviterrae]